MENRLEQHFLALDEDVMHILNSTSWEMLLLAQPQRSEAFS